MLRVGELDNTEVGIHSKPEEPPNAGFLIAPNPRLGGDWVDWLWWRLENCSPAGLAHQRQRRSPKRPRRCSIRRDRLNFLPDLGAPIMKLFASRTASGLLAWAAIGLIGCGGGSSAAAPPGSPTSVSAVAGNGQATVSWTAPATDGGRAITRYAVSASPGSAAATTAGATNVTVTGLTNGTAYTFTVVAINAAGPGPASVPSNSITPSTTAAPTMLLSPASVTFAAAAGGPSPASQSITVTDSRGGLLTAPAVSVSYSSGAGWLSTVVSGSAAPYSITITVNAVSPSVGAYAATLSVTSAGASNSPLTLAVTLTVGNGVDGDCTVAFSGAYSDSIDGCSVVSVTDPADGGRYDFALQARKGVSQSDGGTATVGFSLSLKGQGPFHAGVAGQTTPSVAGASMLVVGPPGSVPSDNLWQQQYVPPVGTFALDITDTGIPIPGRFPGEISYFPSGSLTATMIADVSAAQVNVTATFQGSSPSNGGSADAGCSVTFSGGYTDSNTGCRAAAVYEEGGPSDGGGYNLGIQYYQTAAQSDGGTKTISLLLSVNGSGAFQPGITTSANSINAGGHLQITSPQHPSADWYQYYAAPAGTFALEITDAGAAMPFGNGSSYGTASGRFTAMIPAELPTGASVNVIVTFYGGGRHSGGSPPDAGGCLLPNPQGDGPDAGAAMNDCVYGTPLNPLTPVAIDWQPCCRAAYPQAYAAYLNDLLTAACRGGYRTICETECAFGKLYSSDNADNCVASLSGLDNADAYTGGTAQPYLACMTKGKNSGYADYPTAPWIPDLLTCGAASGACGCDTDCCSGSCESGKCTSFVCVPDGHSPPDGSQNAGECCGLTGSDLTGKLLTCGNFPPIPPGGMCPPTGSLSYCGCNGDNKCGTCENRGFASKEACLSCCDSGQDTLGRYPGAVPAPANSRGLVEAKVIELACRGQCFEACASDCANGGSQPESSACSACLGYALLNGACKTQPCAAALDCVDSCGAGLFTVPTAFTCAVTAAVCTTDAACCSGSCAQGHCVAVACHGENTACSSTANCCSTACTGGHCCAADGQVVVSADQCCSGHNANPNCNPADNYAGCPCCEPLATACTQSSSCCSGRCVDGLCSYCHGDGGSCSAPGDCCSNNCVSGTCRAAGCARNGAACTGDINSSNCCLNIPGECFQHVCGMTCAAAGGPCTTGDDCCNHDCNGTKCNSPAPACRANGAACIQGNQCCSRDCNAAGQCVGAVTCQPDGAQVPNDNTCGTSCCSTTCTCSSASSTCTCGAPTTGGGGGGTGGGVPSGCPDYASCLKITAILGGACGTPDSIQLSAITNSCNYSVAAIVCAQIGTGLCNDCASTTLAPGETTSSFFCHTDGQYDYWATEPTNFTCISNILNECR